MMLPDVNVLIYAFRKDAPQHAVCNPWLTAVVAGAGRFRVAAGFRARPHHHQSARIPASAR